MRINLPDYHIHTTLCNHASGTMEEYVEQAIGLGLEEMGFSDHMPVMPEPHLCMGYGDLPRYIDRVHELQDRCSGRIIIRLGCEMDMVESRTGEIEEIIRTSGFDYVIGSVHYLEGWPFDQEKYKNLFEEKNMRDIYDLFFETVIRAARSGLYDITGHIDNIKRMGYRLDGDMTPYYEKTAAVLGELGLAFELNTSGYDTAAEEAYPSTDFLRILRSRNIPVTTGSDAHLPEQVGRHFTKAVEILQEAGYTETAYFHNRKLIMKPLAVSGNDKTLAPDVSRGLE
jgi:histidinol-phosphatase (PHP family)